MLNGCPMSTCTKSGFLVAFTALSLGLVGCVDPAATDKGEEAEAPADGKLDSFARPTDHGGLKFGMGAEAMLTATEKHHTWNFALTGDASVHLYTGPSITGRGPEIDTVIYLYKLKANGSWGAYTARNDDAHGSLYSSLQKNLGAGSYRLLVKGYAASTRGRFSAHVDCEGAGCAEPATCVLGTTFGELIGADGEPLLNVTGDRHFNVADYATASDLEKQRAIIAVQQSAHTDVTTYQEAFAAMDQGDLRRVDLYDEAGARAFVAYEYGAGDNSYGAIFFYESTEMVANIRDGDFENCETYAQTCALGGDWYTTRNSGAFTTTGTRVVTAASQLTGVDATNALAAIRVAYADATSLANGLTLVDEDQLNVVDLVHTATGTAIRAYEYGAGDNSYGAIYQAGTAERFASIVDLTYYDCSFAE